MIDQMHSLHGLSGDIASAMYAVADYLRRRPGRYVSERVIERDLPAYDRVGSALWRMADDGVLGRRYAARGDLYRWTGRALPCPACPKAVHYVAELDRYVHADGSASDRCWLAVTRGETGL